MAAVAPGRRVPFSAMSQQWANTEITCTPSPGTTLPIPPPYPVAIMSGKCSEFLGMCEALKSYLPVSRCLLWRDCSGGFVLSLCSFLNPGTPETSIFRSNHNAEVSVNVSFRYPPRVSGVPRRFHTPESKGG